MMAIRRSWRGRCFRERNADDVIDDVITLAIAIDEVSSYSYCTPSDLLRSGVWDGKRKSEMAAAYQVPAIFRRLPPNT